MSDTRSPILDYAQYNPVIPFIPTVENVGVILWLTEDNIVMTSEDSEVIDIEG